MKILNKLATATIAGTIIAGSSLGSVQGTYAAGKKDESKDSNQNADVAYMGNTKNPKNVIFLVGDGMGASYNSADLYFADNADTNEMEQTGFDKYLVGSQRTDPNDPKEDATDSAADATALGSGQKTYSGAIGVDANKAKV